MFKDQLYLDLLVNCKRGWYFIQKKLKIVENMDKKMAHDTLVTRGHKCMLSEGQSVL